MQKLKLNQATICLTWTALLFSTAISISNFLSMRHGKFIEDYIIKNPEVVEKAVNALNERVEQERQKAGRNGLVKNSKSLATAPVALGADTAKISIIEFMDYKCSVCRSAAKEINDIFAKDNNIKLIVHQAPVLSPLSLVAAKYAYASSLQGKFKEAHNALISESFNNELDIENILSRAGVDVDSVKRIKDSAEVKNMIDNDMRMFAELKLEGVPAFITRENIVSGWNKERILDIINGR